MRRRVLALVFATTLFAVTLLGALLIGTIWAVMGAATQARAQANAELAVGVLEDRVERGQLPLTSRDLQRLARDHALLVAKLPDNSTVSTGPALDGGTFSATATQNGVTVTASIPVSVLRGQVLGQAAVVVGIAALALAVSMLVAWFYTKRLVKPLEDFAQQAARIASGDARQLGRRYGVPEIDAAAEVLDYGVMGFNSLLENERRVTSEVSHQLRTPLTALSLRLEEVLAAETLDEVRAEATAALGQVERLSGVIDEVASVNRGLVGPVVPYSVDALVDDQITEWLPAFEAAERGLDRRGRTRRLIEGVRGMQSQVLATLIENSLVHGGGRTTIRVRESGSWVVIEVVDEGPGVPRTIEPQVFERSVSGAESTGLGLALARTLIAADGGRLEMLSARPAVFAMFLPSTRSMSEVVAAPEELAAGEDAPGGPDQTDVWIAASSAASTSSGNTQRR